jgi:phosphoribosylamine--glycine ligase
MKVLVIGGGGREHALIWKLAQSKRVAQLFCAPGNAGIASLAKCVPIPANDIPALAEFAEAESVDLTVVGPDDTLAAGVVDLFSARGLQIFGPTQFAARLESSKIFAKEFMLRHGIPTATSGRFTDPDAARKYAISRPTPVVVKADGLALGKGVVIAETHEQAVDAVEAMMVHGRFGHAGSAVVIEEYLEGIEISAHALVDGSSYLLFPFAQDHKRIGDGDTGPNTGGMGTYSPVTKWAGAEVEAQVRAEVLDRFVAGLQRDQIPYRGMLFPGLMLTRDGVKVLEFNCRFGDPETQVLLPRLATDLVELLLATVNGTLASVAPACKWTSQTAVCVIAASPGYPGIPSTGHPIQEFAPPADGVHLFHAGTKRGNDGTLLTSGGRVLGVTALGEDLSAARSRAYAAIETIHFDGIQYRRDIGAKGL